MVQSIRFIILFCLFIFTLSLSYGTDSIDGLYLKAFGNPKNSGIVFVHGGPDYNSYDFELTTAPKLAEQGFYVVVYDQRGQGRSAVTDSRNYNYDAYAEDIKSIIKKYKLRNTSLIGHSHGGAISIHAQKKYPTIIKKVVLLAAPLNWPALIKSVINNCSSKYISTQQLNYLKSLREIQKSFGNYDALKDEQKIHSVFWLFNHALACGLYDVSGPSLEFKKLMLLMKVNPIKDLISENREKPMPGFMINENYIMKNWVDAVKASSESYCGIYGEEDGLFTKSSLEEIQETVSKFKLLQGSSHAIYMQRQKEFFRALKEECGLR